MNFDFSIKIEAGNSVLTETGAALQLLRMTSCYVCPDRDCDPKTGRQILIDRSALSKADMLIPQSLCGLLGWYANFNSTGISSMSISELNTLSEKLLSARDFISKAVTTGDSAHISMSLL